MCLYYILLLFISPLPVLLVKKKIGFIINLIIYTFFIVSTFEVYLSDLLSIQKGSGSIMEYIYFNIFGYLNSNFHPDLKPLWIVIYWFASVVHGNICLSEPSYISQKKYREKLKET